MTAFIKVSTGEYPRHEGDIRLEHPEILESQTGDTFPCPSDYAIVEVTAPPSFNYSTQQVTEGQPEFVDGVWRTTWVVAEAPPQSFVAEETQKLNNMTGSAPDVLA